MPKIILAALVAAAVLMMPASASAAVKSCGTRGFDFGRVTVKTAGATSCPFGWNAYRAFRKATINNGRYPQSFRVKSPVTGGTYRLARVSQKINGKKADWRYTGVGDHSSTLDVRIHWKRY